MVPAAMSLEWLRRLTIDQWRAIDAERRDQTLPSHHAAWILVTAAIALILPRYFGQEGFWNKSETLSALSAEWRYPDLWPRLYWGAFKLVNYGLVPALCIKLVLKGRIVDHGLRFVHEPRAWLLYVCMLLLVIPMAYVASKTDAFLQTYPKYRAAGDSWSQFLSWEIAYGFQFLMLEFFFRGFLIFALARYIGSLAIFVMIVPYAMIHFGKPFAECLGSVIAGIALGTVALRTGSIYGGVFVHCGVAWSMDLFAMSQNGSLARLLGSSH
jgi:membrane protease YdiL (CAAX protease family)